MTTDLQQRTSRRTWSLNPIAVVRVGGLSYDLVHRLRSVELRDAVVARRTARAAVEQIAERVSEAAYGCIGGLTNDGLRRALIRLRRDVHNGRPARIATALPPELVGEVEAYSDALEALSAADDGVSAAVSDSFVESRAVLRAVAEEQDLRLGMQLSSVEIDQHVDRWLQAPETEDKRSRHLETSLVEYLQRTAAKTSPFGRLTSVVAAQMDETPVRTPASAPLAINGASGPKLSRARLSLTVLSRIAGALVASAHVRPALVVELVQGVEVRDVETLSYWRRSVHRGDDSGAVVLDSVHESRFLIPRGEVTAAVVDRLHGGRTRTSFLVDALVRDHPDWSRDDLMEHIGLLVEVGVLVVPQLAIDVHADDPLPAFRDAVAAIGTPYADLVAGRLTSAAEDVGRFADADLVERRRLLSSVRSALGAALDDVEAVGVSLPQTLIFEDSTIDGARVIVNAQWWNRRLDDLEAVARLLPAFDLNGVRRAAMTGYFERRFGVGVRVDDLLDFVHDFELDFAGNLEQRLSRHRRFVEGDLRPVDNWFRQPEIAAFDDARVRFRDAVVEASRHADNAGADVVDLATWSGTDLLDAVPASPLPLTGWSFFTQVAGERVVVNRIHAGLGLTHSRFLGLLADQVGPVADHLQRVTPDGTVLAELVGGVDTTNLNLHPAVLPYEIVCPGQSSTRPADRQLPVEDLAVEHLPDEGRLRLVSRRLGLEVVPVYQGFLVPMALPGLQRALLLFGSTGPVSLDVWEGTATGDEVTARPRVDWGSVTLARRSWTVPAACWPFDATNRRGTEAVLAWQHFSDEHDLPERVFVTIPGESKPCFVDRWSVRSIHALATTTGQVTGVVLIAEADPDPAATPTDVGGERRVLEVTVELNGRKSN